MFDMLPGEPHVDSADVPQSSIMDGLRAHKRKMELTPFAVSPLCSVKLGQHSNYSPVPKSSIFHSKDTFKHITALDCGYFID